MRRRHLFWLVLSHVVVAAAAWVGGQKAPEKDDRSRFAVDLPAEVTVNLPDPAKEKGSPLMARTVVVHWSFDSFGRKAARERTVQGDDVWVTVKYPDGRGATYYGTLLP